MIEVRMPLHLFSEFNKEDVKEYLEDRGLDTSKCFKFSKDFQTQEYVYIQEDT